jgi:hypothetical protein
MAALTIQDYKATILFAEVENKQQDKIVRLFDQIESDLFMGKEEVQPVKWHQVGRIYRLAKSFIEFIVIVWPYIKMIIKLLK